MKHLKDFEQELYKCSRCALCHSVCPVYKASLNECAVSKGKFNMLNGIIKGDLSLTKQIKKYMDLCTGCNACKNFCPSGIDARKIFTAVKCEYYEKHEQSLTQKLINSYFLFKFLLVCASISLCIYRALRIDLFVVFCKRLIHKPGEIAKKILLFNFLALKEFKENVPQNHSSENEKTKTAIFFEGCFNKYINSETENAVRKILTESNINLVRKNFECCGISYLSDGNMQELKKLIEKNLSQTDTEFDYFVTDCASCNDVLKQYKDFTANPKALEVHEKAISVIKLIENLHFESTECIKAAVHIPCHEENDIEKIVKNIDNLHYVEADDYDKCCGFSGAFALKNPEISKEISRQKALNYIQANADVILTTCPACMLGLQQGLIEVGNTALQKPKVMNLFVFLAKHCKKSKQRL